MAWTQQFQDTFTGSVFTSWHTHDAAWVEDSGVWQLNGAGCGGVSSGTTENHCGNTTTLNTTKQAAEVLFGATSTFGEGGGVLLHYTHVGAGQRTGYRGMSFGGNVYIVKDNGASAGDVLTSTAYTHTPGDTLRLEADGASLTLLINGTPLLSASDSTYTTAFCAAYQYAANAGYFDTFTAYDDAGGGGGNAPGKRLAALGVG